MATTSLHQFNTAIARLGSIPPPSDSRGIVICCFSADLFASAWIHVRLLREIGCTLPIQIWHCGSDQIDEYMASLLVPLKAECVDARLYARRTEHSLFAGWSLRALAVVHCPYSDVLCVDADVTVVNDPEYIFTSEEYRQVGAIFWPGPTMTDVSKPVYKELQIPGRVESDFAPEQFAVDKRRHGKALQLALWFAKNHRSLQSLCEPQKDSFRLAWRTLNNDFAMPYVGPQIINAIGLPPGVHVTCHHDFSGERIFQHRGLLRWRFFAENPRLPGLLFEGDCRTFLDRIRSLWNGRAGGVLTVEIPDSCKSVAERLMATSWLAMVRSRADLQAHDRVQVRDRPEEQHAGRREKLKRDLYPKPKQRSWREFRFLRDGTLGITSDERYSFWALYEDSKNVRLEIFGNGRDAGKRLKFHLDDDGTWRRTEASRLGKYLATLKAVEDIYPSSSKHSSAGGEENGIRTNAHVELKVFNSAFGIGDHVTSAYACVGAANAGYKVVFHTRHPQWLSRIRHPNLTIVGADGGTLDFPLSARRAKIRREACDANGWIDLNYDYAQQLRFGYDKARWYSDAIHPNLRPGRPDVVNTCPTQKRLDSSRYVVLAPFAAWSVRNWPDSHWRRLAFYLTERGWDVVAIGAPNQAQRFEAVFSLTNAFWALGHPPDWVQDVMLDADAVIGNDSGMSHVAGLLGVPTIAIHSHLSSAFLWSQTQVQSVIPEVQCAPCHWRVDRGFVSACNQGCSALATISPDKILEKFLAIVGSREITPSSNG